jgi:hypothetical protein
LPFPIFGGRKILINTISLSKDNEAARKRRRKRIVPYAEEADDEANKVSQRKRIGITFSDSRRFVKNKS